MFVPSDSAIGICVCSLVQQFSELFCIALPCSGKVVRGVNNRCVEELCK